MKYKRQFMGSMIALALLVGNYSSADAEDFVPPSKVSQYMNQVQMKSEKKEDKMIVKNKKNNSEQKG